LFLTQNGLSLTTLCNDTEQTYNLSVDSICPSILILSEVQDESLGKTLQLNSVKIHLVLQKKKN